MATHFGIFRRDGLCLSVMENDGPTALERAHNRALNACYHERGDGFPGYVRQMHEVARGVYRRFDVATHRERVREEWRRNCAARRNKWETQRKAIRMMGFLPADLR